MFAKLSFATQEMFNIDKIKATCHASEPVFVYIEHFRHLQDSFAAVFYYNRKQAEGVKNLKNI